MDTTERLKILRRHGFTQQVAAAILGADLSDIHDEALDPSDVPSLGAVDLAPLEGRVTTLEDAPPVDLEPLEDRVTTLEDATPVDLAPLEGRVTTLEGAPTPGVSGWLSMTCNDWVMPAGTGQQIDTPIFSGDFLGQHGDHGVVYSIDPTVGVILDSDQIVLYQWYMAVDGGEDPSTIEFQAVFGASRNACPVTRNANGTGVSTGSGILVTNGSTFTFRAKDYGTQTGYGVLLTLAVVKLGDVVTH